MDIIRWKENKILTGFQKNDKFSNYILVRQSICIPHILIKTQEMQHPDCVEISVWNRRYVVVSVNTNKYSVAYNILSGVGLFEVGVRWRRSHDPYPEIERMEIWIFGEYMGDHVYRIAGAASIDDKDDYDKVANVEVLETGEVLVNNKSVGMWPDMLEG